MRTLSRCPWTCPAAGLMWLSVAWAGCRTNPTRDLTLSAVDRAPATSSTPRQASVEDAGVEAASPVVDRRPAALSRLVPFDDSEEGYAGPTGTVPDCDDELQRAGVSFRVSELPVHTQRSVTCGAPQVVLYLRGPGNITYDPAPVLTCAMALAMAAFELVVQEEATRTFHVPVIRVQQIGTYSCREIAAVKGLASEHSYANAIDLTRFTLSNGKVITVLSDFDMGDTPPARPAGAFLRAISLRAHRENVFSNVLTPFWDLAHNNHFHVDLARYRVNGVERRAL